MKKIITILLIVISSITFAQEQLKQEFLVYVPLRTYHWDRSALHTFHPTEGGNFGTIFILRNYQTEKVYTEKQFGMVRNSYGTETIVAQQGVGYSYNNINISLAAGLATGYNEVYENGNLKNLPGILKNNGIVPTITTCISFYTKKRLQPTIVLSPTYINAGLVYKIK